MKTSFLGNLGQRYFEWLLSDKVEDKEQLPAKIDKPKYYIDRARGTDKTKSTIVVNFRNCHIEIDTKNIDKAVFYGRNQ